MIYEVGSMLKIIFVTVLSLFICSAAELRAQAQESHEVVIEVRIKGDGRAIKRAEIRVGTEPFYTGPDGKVKISLPEGDGKILVNRHGYEKQFVEYADLRALSEFAVYLEPGT